MSQTKRITGDYTIDPSGTLRLNSNTIITGDLTIVGTNTSVETTNTEITDRLILLNKGESGAGVTGNVSGIEIDRGSNPSSMIVYRENANAFFISTDSAVTYQRILLDIESDLTPSLGGDIDVNGYNIVSTVSNQDIMILPNGTGNVVIDSSIRLTDQPAPTAVTGSTLIHAGTTVGGGTGVFFVDGAETGEMVSKTKAIAFAIIF